MQISPDRQTNLVGALSQAGGSAELWHKVIESRRLVDWLVAEQVSALRVPTSAASATQSEF
jgi:hypothetical protein